MAANLIYVSTPVELLSAIGSATGGETILLSAGEYGDISIYHEHFASNIKIVGGNFSSIYLSDVNNVTFDNINIKMQALVNSDNSQVAFQATSSDQIHITNSVIVGSLAINGVDDSAVSLDYTGNVIGRPFGKGISLNYTSNSSVYNTEISSFSKGISFSSGSNLTIDNNYFHDMRIDDIEGSVDSGLLITNNRLEQSMPWNVADHPDRIHIFTNTKQITGLTITGNVFSAGTGDVVQGIYLDDNHKGLGFSGAIISNNTISDSSAIGIMLENVTYSTVSDNTLIWSGLGTIKSNSPKISVQYGSHDISFNDNSGDVFIADGARSLTFVRQAGMIAEEATMTSADRDTIVIDNMVITAHNTYTLNATTSDLYFEGGIGNFVGTGNALANHIVGDIGNDTLTGNGGADFLEGKTGNDTYVVDNLGQRIYDSGGTELVRSKISWTLQTGLENLTYIGTGGATLNGNSAPNTIIGGGGNDTLIGNGGADKLQGGLGNDTYILDNSNQLVSDSGGVDTIVSNLNKVLQSGIENLTLTGAAVFATGNAVANTLIGNDLNNTLDGKAGADLMYGNAGDDTYIVDNVGDRAIEIVSGIDAGGNDTIKTALTGWTLGAGIESLVYTGSVSFAGTGNALDNYIAGGAAIDTLNGGAGADRIYGNAGDDIINGGVGSDQLSGGTGNDKFIFYRGEAYADTITDFNGRGTAAGDTIELRGWGTGSTFTNVAGTNFWVVHDGLDGYEEYISVTGAVDPSEWSFTQSVTSMADQATAMSATALDTQGVDLLMATATETDLLLNNSDTPDFSSVLEDGSDQNDILPVEGEQAAQEAAEGSDAFEPVAADGHGGGHDAIWVEYARADHHVSYHYA